MDFCKSLSTKSGKVRGCTSPWAAKGEVDGSTGSHMLNSASQFCRVLIGMIQSTVLPSVYLRNTSQNDTTCVHSAIEIKCRGPQNLKSLGSGQVTNCDCQTVSWAFATFSIAATTDQLLILYKTNMWLDCHLLMFAIATWLSASYYQLLYGCYLVFAWLKIGQALKVHRKIWPSLT